MLKGKTALITGANGGIGKSVLDLFLKNDANVICLIRKQDKKFEKYVKKFSKKVNIIETDLTDEKNLKIKLEKIFSKKKKLDLLINNAGTASGSIIEMTSQKNLKQVFDVNFFSQIRLTQLVLKNLKRSRQITISPLEMSVKNKFGKSRKALAINEVSILRQSRQAAYISIHANKKIVIKQLVSDGVLVSTPAGSTAYNLSVHGPILSLNSKKLSIAPISPFRPRRWRGKIISEKSPWAGFAFFSSNL